MHPIIASRIDLHRGQTGQRPVKGEEEGGCGVVGFAASVPVRGRHIFEPSFQMRNRGNGKGGGIAAACLVPEQLGVDAKTLREDYIVQVALLDGAAEAEVEKTCILPFLDVHQRQRLDPVGDYRDLGLEVRPPDIVRYFARVKPEVLGKFADNHDGLGQLPPRALEDEFIFQNSFRLNERFYASLGEKRAFVVSHARNLVIFKIVGFAEDVVRYYGLEDMCAQIWIAHQRYPTKGRVWHPGGAHPFIGMNEALVHNGDFANYYSVTEYLRQHNLRPQFLTDTEVSVQLFDLWNRVYHYPLEYLIEAMAPTTELDLDQLPGEKRRIYRAIQSLHVHSSPDGPWFFIIARSDPDQDAFQLLGITDTSMLRPQVFAIQEGDVSIGLIASEKQAIDATLSSLSQDDPRFRQVADRYWNARGGSHTDGGAFTFTLKKQADGYGLICADKFGRGIAAPAGEYKIGPAAEAAAPAGGSALLELTRALIGEGCVNELFVHLTSALKTWRLTNFQWLVEQAAALAAKNDDCLERTLELLTLLVDRRYDCGGMRRSAMLEILHGAIRRLLDGVTPIAAGGPGRFRRIDWASRGQLKSPQNAGQILVSCAAGYPPEGDDCDSRMLVKAFQLGWRRFIVYGLKGQRFTGCGFGPATEGVRIDVYDSSGDYLASGIDGMEIHVHGNAQDQLCQIMKSGKLVVHGDVGQAFMYGAKGGELYILGNTAGRPLINAAGRPRVVINGTSLDYLAESFMAGDPHKGGGFVVLNGIRFDDKGQVQNLPSPYPGSNLFSLASGGAIYVRDPYRKLVPDQLNGGEFMDLTEKDWELILPHLKANERYFGIAIERDLLTVDGELREPQDVYLKVVPVKLSVLTKEAVPE